MTGRDICFAFQQKLKAAQDEDVVVDADSRPKVTIQMLQVEGDTSAAVVHFRNEDHTLGNPIRHMLMSRPDVLAAGYVIPHPLEPMMKLQVQSRGFAPRVVGEALESLALVCDGTREAFLQAVSAHDKGKRNVD